MNDQPARDVAERLDEQIRQHMYETEEFQLRGAPVAAVSVSDRMTWAKRADVDLETVDARLEALCEKIDDRSEQWAVPRYRWGK